MNTIKHYLLWLQESKCPPGRYTWNSLKKKCVKSPSEEEEYDIEYDIDQVGGSKTFAARSKKK